MWLTLYDPRGEDTMSITLFGLRREGAMITTLWGGRRNDYNPMGRRRNEVTPM